MQERTIAAKFCVSSESLVFSLTSGSLSLATVLFFAAPRISPLEARCIKPLGFGRERDPCVLPRHLYTDVGTSGWMATKGSERLI